MVAMIEEECYKYRVTICKYYSTACQRFTTLFMRVCYITSHHITSHYITLSSLLIKYIAQSRIEYCFYVV
jgi:hypothetical protein